MSRRVLLLAGLVACGSSGTTPRDASMDRTPCEAAYQQALDRSCTTATDCTLVGHDDCCGTVRIGVRAGTEAAAATAESAYGACFDCGARGCDHADQAEDGSTPGAGQTIVATCVDSRCTSIVQ